MAITLSISRRQVCACDLAEERFMDTKSRFEDALTVVDPVTYRSALGCFASGVTILTTNAAEEPVGTTVSAFSALSLVPPFR